MPVELDQSIFGLYLNRSFEVLAVAYESDGAGGLTEAPTVVAAEAGRLRPMTPREAESAKRLDPGAAHTASHVLYVAYPTAIERGQYVRDSVRTSRRYRVVGLQELSLAEHHVAVHLAIEVSPSPEVA